MEQEIDSILESKEKILWRGKMNLPMLKTILVAQIVIGLLLSSLPVIISLMAKSSDGPKIMGNGAYYLALFLGFAVVVFSVGNYYYEYLTEYILTEKRFIIRSGLIGVDFSSVYYDQIRNSTVNVGLIDKIFNVGTIRIDTGDVKYVDDPDGNGQMQSVYTLIKHIEQPYDVYRKFQDNLSDRKESLYSGRADEENQG